MTLPQRFLHPHGWKRPKGYANGIAVEGRNIFLAGQVDCNAEQQFESEDFVAWANAARRRGDSFF